MTARPGRPAHTFNVHPIWARLEELRIADSDALSQKAIAKAPTEEQLALAERNLLLRRAREAAARVLYAPHESYRQNPALLEKDFDTFHAGKAQSDTQFNELIISQPTPDCVGTMLILHAFKQAAQLMSGSALSTANTPKETTPHLTAPKLSLVTPQ